MIESKLDRTNDISDGIIKIFWKFLLALNPSRAPDEVTEQKTTARRGDGGRSAELKGEDYHGGVEAQNQGEGCGDVGINPIPHYKGIRASIYGGQPELGAKPEPFIPSS